LNGAVEKQIDSVLQNLSKKMKESEKQRIRAVMASLTAENMRLDLELRRCARMLDRFDGDADGDGDDVSPDDDDDDDDDKDKVDGKRNLIVVVVVVVVCLFVVISDF
jgi:regulator of replication initiation timing